MTREDLTFQTGFRVSVGNDRSLGAVMVLANQMISLRALWLLLHRDCEFRSGSRAPFERRPLIVCLSPHLLTEMLHRREPAVCADFVL